jgi:WD40 repeat protein
MLTISKDRFAAEYSLGLSSKSSGIVSMGNRRIEQIHRPVSAILVDLQHEVHSEEQILSINSDLKLRNYSSSTKVCKKTALCPTFGGPISSMTLIPQGPNIEERYIAFACRNQVIGAVRLHATGNPYEGAGVIAHPRKIVHICSSKNGAYILSCGESDRSVHMWSFQNSVLEHYLTRFGSGIEPFLKQLDPKGADGTIYKDFEDFFYYAQIKEYF